MLTSTARAAGGLAGRSRPVERARAGLESAVPAGVWACGIFLGVLASAALAFAVARPVQVVPLLRPAPPMVLRDLDGGVIASARLAGTILVVQLSALRCSGPCDDGHAALQTLQRRLEAAAPAVPVRLVTILLDSDAAPDALRSRRAATGVNPRWWRLATADAVHLKEVVGAGFGVYYTTDRDGRVAFEPATFLVDGRGLVRAEYREVPPDPHRVVRDLDLVVREASSPGAARMFYAAAHAFLCYPR